MGSTLGDGVSPFPLQREFLLQSDLQHGERAALPAGFDEMMAAPGAIRPHWQALCDALADIPAKEMASRWARGQREISENGITFHVHGETPELGRRWQLDPLPMPIDGPEWTVLAKGLKQRALLLDAILADLYGPRLLLRERALPAALVYGHPGYLRPCVGLHIPRNRHLHLYAADLARGPDGGWRVIGDRTDAPGGIGYVLENRQIVSRILPEVRRACPLRPLEPFLDSLRSALPALSPRRFDTPRVVLLTPGPGNGSYFEHAYLAQHLGCMLAEASDLTARDDRVFLKTLDGLRPVDVILRTTAGVLCDPLELDSNSSLGVAGLVAAVRAGSVTVVNALGSGVVEGPALAAYLPDLCQRLLGEPLALPSVPTWWCGDETGLRHVLANLDRMVVKYACRPDCTPIFGDTLSTAERETLVAAMTARPQDYVGQDILPLSTAPVWSDGQWATRHVALRAFLACTDKGLVMMDGGLTRVSTTRALPSLAVRNGEGGSKDTWVLSGPACSPAEPPAQVTLRLTRSGRDLTSRAADDMFWFGRYLERCEDLTRMLRPLYGRAMIPLVPGTDAAAGPLLGLLTQLGLTTAKARARGLTHLGQAAATLSRMHFDPDCGTGLRANADRLLHTSSAIRDRLSLDTWRNMLRLHGEVRDLRPDAAPEDVAIGLNALILTLEAASGLIMENMTRGLAWRFLDIGRRLERATHMIDLLAAAAEAPPAERESVLETLLEISDSSMTYRSRYMGTPQLPAVLDLLLCDEGNPRSAGFQFAVLADHVDHLKAKSDPPRMRADQRLMIFLAGTVRTADIDILSEPEEDGALFKLSTVLELLRSRLWELSETLTREYFTHANRRGNMA